jgi:large subunit ribosomal protein L17
MRHRKKINHLGRTASHRNAMLSNMANSLILHKRISTTTAKAKALRSYLEPIITKSKDDSTHSRRVVFKYLQSKEAVTELFREISPKIADRPGGYTRILKTGTRLGDSADMCVIELVDYNENLLSLSEDAKGKTGRKRRRSGSKAKEAVAATDVVEEAKVIVEEPKAQEDSSAKDASSEEEKKAE